MADRPRPPALPGCKACSSRIRRRDGSVIHADDCPLDAPVYLALTDAFRVFVALEAQVVREKQRVAEAIQEYRQAAFDLASNSGSSRAGA